MKIIKAMALLVLFAGGVFAAEPYEYWTFDNDAAGKAFGANWENSGVLESTWNYGGPETMATDGTGNLVVSNHSGQVYRKLNAYAAPFTTGVYRLELDLASWDLDSAAVGSSLAFGAMSDAGNSGSVIAGFKVSVFDATTVKMQMLGHFGGTVSNYRTLEYSPADSTGLSMAIEFDFDADTVTYFTNGVVSHNLSDFTGSQIETLQFNVNNTWATNSVLVIDQMGLLGPDRVPSLLAVDFDGSSITNVKYSGAIRSLDAATPDLAAADGYGGQPVYAGYYEENGGGNSDLSSPTWMYADHKNDTWGHGGIRIQINGPEPQTGTYDLGDVMSGVAMFRKEDFLNGMNTNSVFMDADNDTLSATLNYDLGSPERFLSGAFRWVIQDDGQYYTSEASTYTASGIKSESAEATEIAWFNYDPVSDASNIAVIGSSASPALENIQMIGFQISATCQTNIAARTYPGVQVLDFSAAAAFGEATPTSLWNDWLAEFSLGSATGLQDHADSDMLDNLTEYVWGGDPSDGNDMGIVPVQSQINDGGIDYIEYVYYERADAAARGLASILEVGTDLVYGGWVDGSLYETGRGTSGVAGYNAVTNRIPTDTEAKQFIRLQIEFTP